MRLPKAFTKHVVEMGLVALAPREAGSVYEVEDDDPALDDLFVEADLCCSGSRAATVDTGLAPHIAVSARHTLEAMLRQGFKPGRVKVQRQGCKRAGSAPHCTHTPTTDHQQETAVMPETVINPPSHVDPEDVVEAPKPKPKRTGKKAAPKTEAASAAKGKKETATKEPKSRVRNEKQNGVTRPNPETNTGKVWGIADEISRKKKAPATRAEVVEAGVASGINPATVTTQYGRWRRFYGITGSLKAPKPTPTEGEEAGATTH